MADPYWRYTAERDSIPPAGRGLNLARASSGYGGYLSSDGSVLGAHHLWKGNDLGGPPSDYLQSDILRSGAYGRDDIMGRSSLATPGLGVTPGLGSIRPGLGGITPGLGALTAGTSLGGGYSSLEDPALISQRRDPTLGVKPSIPDILTDRSTPSLRKADSLSADESNILFVEGLPNDCTRREVAHLFRPFIGFKEIRVVHKEPRRSGDKALVLCFVEFNDAKCALTALDALQGYKFDDKKPDAPALKIQYAHFPFRPTSGHDDNRAGAR